MSDDQQDRNDQQDDQPAEPSMNDLLRQALANGRTRMARPRDEAGRFAGPDAQAPAAEPGGFGGGQGGMTGEGGPPQVEDTMTELIRDAVWGRRR